MICHTMNYGNRINIAIDLSLIYKHNRRPSRAIYTYIYMTLGDLHLCALLVGFEYVVSKLQNQIFPYYLQIAKCYDK